MNSMPTVQPGRIAASAKVAAFLASDLGSVIDGAPARRGQRRRDVVNPATGQVVASFDLADATLVDAAVDAARRALAGPWGSLRPADRERILMNLAELIAANADELAELEVLDNGMLAGFARQVSIGASVEFLRYMAGWATKIEGSTLDVSIPHAPDQQAWGYTLRQPIGVVGAITPWNVPFLMAAWKLGPALAAGCTLVLKPAEETSLSAIRLAQLALEAGIPPGVFNVVTGLGEDVGAALAAHPGVDKLAFTGSTAVGKAISRAAVEAMTPVTLELGGKSPIIILDDADVDEAAVAAAQAIFINSGQICTAGSRLYVHRSVYAPVVERLAAIADGLTVGPGEDPKSQVGPLVSAVQQSRVLSFLHPDVLGGARIATQRRLEVSAGFYAPPTVIADAAQSSALVQQEIFGPVIVAIPFDNLDEVVELANDSAYGLGASVWSNSQRDIDRLVRRLRVGIVWINTHNLIDPNLPFGGVKQSGLGREMGRGVVESYTTLKAVCAVS